jgi:integrase
MKSPKPITTQLIKRLKACPPDSTTTVWDERVQSFLLRVTPAGRITFGINFYDRFGKERRFSFARAAGSNGKLPVMSVSDARARAKALLRNTNKGLTPIGEILNDPLDHTTISLAAFYEEYSELHLTTCSQAHVDNWNSFKRKHLSKTEFWHKRLGQVTRLDLQEFHKSVTRLSKPVAANRMICLLRALFNKAIDWDLIQDNPATRIDLNKEKARERFLTPNERQQLFYYLENHRNRRAADLVWLLAKTGQRLGEVRTSMWTDFDLEKGIWVIPDTKNGTNHTLPLSREVVMKLKSIREVGDSEWVFPNNKGTGPVYKPKSFWKVTRGALGLNDVRLHDLRHTYASAALEAGIEIERVSKILNHKSIATTQRYVHLLHEKKREAIDQIDAIL